MQEIKQDEMRRIPGLFRRWELPQVLECGVAYHIEDAGETACGTRLVAIYRNAPEKEVVE